MQREADRDRDPGIELQPDQREAVIDHEELHQERRALEQRDIACRDALHQRPLGDPHQRDGKPEHAPADEADQREQHGPFETGEQEEEFVRSHRALTSPDS